MNFWGRGGLEESHEGVQLTTVSQNLDSKPWLSAGFRGEIYHPPQCPRNTSYKTQTTQGHTEQTPPKNKLLLPNCLLSSQLPPLWLLASAAWTPPTRNLRRLLTGPPSSHPTDSCHSCLHPHLCSAFHTPVLLCFCSPDSPPVFLAVLSRSLLLAFSSLCFLFQYQDFFKVLDLGP